MWRHHKANRSGGAFDVFLPNLPALKRLTLFAPLSIEQPSLGVPQGAPVPVVLARWVQARKAHRHEEV
jgi:hypothetical protein